MYNNHNPKLKNHLRLEGASPDALFLIAERHTTLVSDPLYIQLLPLLTEDLGLDDIVYHLRGKIPEAYVYYGLEQLEKQGYLDRNTIDLPADMRHLCEYLQVDLDAAAQRLRTLSVSVSAVGEFANTNITHRLATLLEAHHIQVADSSLASDLAVVLCDDYLHPSLADFNQSALERSCPWLLIKPVGTEIWLGPLFYPARTGCWDCLADRLLGNRPVEGYLMRQTQAVAPLTPPQTHFSAVVQAALSMAVIEVFKWMVQRPNRGPLEGQLITYDSLSLDTQRHTLTRRPQCPTCGNSGCGNSGQSMHTRRQKLLPLVLGRRPKGFTADGGHRCQSPETVLRRLQHHISPVTGVVRSLQKLPSGLGELQNNYVAQHHFLATFDDLRALSENIGGRSGGKGQTDSQARMSAFGEAIERYSGVFQGDEPKLRSTYLDLAEHAIHPNACMNFSQRQYADRHTWNPGCEKIFQQVPEPFDESREIDWTPIWSMTQRQYKYLPTAYCYFGYPRQERPDCWADTNGCAAGSTLEEAILQGFMELVERDAVALWWYNRLSKPQVDLASFEDEYFQRLLQAYGDIHRQLWVLDITSDLDIPCFVAVSRCCDRTTVGQNLRGTEDILLGFGCHFDARLAISRALTEVNQFLPAVLSTQADGTTKYASSADSFTLDWWQNATIKNQPYLVPVPETPIKRAGDYTVQWSDDLLVDVQHCQYIIEQQGLEMLVLDQTRPDIGLNVVKVVVPGLRHYWKRLGPGRLYDVPVKMGWLAEPRSEAELNPLPMCL